MKKALFVLLTCLLASCVPMSEEEKMVSDGRKIFLRKCSSCHGTRAEGKPGIPSLKGAPDRYTDHAIRSFIQNGRGEGKQRMPPVRKISEQEILRVILYLKTLKK